MILGTAGYMAPEQVRGKPVDKRADIWAFGVVLYEMVTGRPLFGGEDASEILAAVLKQEPDLGAAPPKVCKLLPSCLEKQPDRRLRDIADAWLLLADDPAPASSRRSVSMVIWPVVAAVAFLALAAVSWLHFRETPSAPKAALRFQIPQPESAGALGALLNISPDGRKLAFLAGGRIWVHFLESGESRDLTQATGTPFWSPDSRFIAYPLSRKLMRIEATGGVPHTLTEFRGLWGAGTWNQNDVIVFSDRDAIFRVPAAGGSPVQLTAVDPARQDTIQYSPRFLPDGTHFLYTRRSTDERNSDVLIGSIDAKPEAQSSAPLVKSFWGAHYSPSGDPNSGYVLFMRDSTLMAQPMDPRRLVTTGQAVPVAEHIDDGRAFSVSGSGVLVFQSQSLTSRLTWFDREGKEVATVGNPDFFRWVRVSPDGTRAVLASGAFGTASNLWMLDLSSGLRTRFGLSTANEQNPIWTPAGDRVIFASNRAGGKFDLYQQPVNGAGTAEIIYQSAEDKWPSSCSPDGRFLLYVVSSRATGFDIWLLPLDGTRTPLSFLQTEANENSPRFSPDGHWVAYTSNESGRDEVYVRSFSMKPGAAAVESGDKHMISDSGGTTLQWRADGREFYYIRASDRMPMAVDIMSQAGFRAGRPHPVIETGPLSVMNAPNAIASDQSVLWDAARDGKRFLAALRVNNKPEPYTVILNWQFAVKR
jgi:eukaryotic-like serine/threonine-protein kinase